MNQTHKGLYEYLVWDFRTPYRLFLDDGVYFVRVGSVRWRVSLRSEPSTELTTGYMPVTFSARAQFRLDNHGYTGRNVVRVGYPLQPPMTQAQVMAMMTSADRLTLEEALRPLNQMIALYRAKTDEFWFRPLAPSDIPFLTLFLLPVGSHELEWLLWKSNEELATGSPYLKSEAWYADLARRLERDERPPFHLELRGEGRDALARNNYRLAAADYALAVEALFRALLRSLLPGEDTTRPVEAMLGTYFRRYREIGDPAELPLSKKEAQRALRLVWSARDELMHGHDVALTADHLEAVSEAVDALLQLWDARPGSDPLLVEGPFVGGSILSSDLSFLGDAPGLVLRAISRLNTGHLDDAAEAARFALSADPTSFDAAMIQGLVALDRGDLGEAAEWFRRALEIDPERVEARHNLEHCERRMSESPKEGEEGRKS